MKPLRFLARALAQETAIIMIVALKKTLLASKKFHFLFCILGSRKTKGIFNGHDVHSPKITEIWPMEWVRC